MSRSVFLLFVLLSCRAAPDAVPPPCPPPRLDEARVRESLPAALPTLASQGWRATAVELDACPGSQPWDRALVTLEAPQAPAPRPAWRAIVTLRLSVPDARLVAGDERDGLQAVLDAAARRDELEALPAVAAWLTRHPTALVLLEAQGPEAVVHVRPLNASPADDELRLSLRAGGPFALATPPTP